jgi:four helix bundle protein
MEGIGVSQIASYRQLSVWNKSMDLTVYCYSMTTSFPESERFGLISQIRRSSASIPANIAEGHGRKSTGAFLNHLSIANGSLMELETHILLGQRLLFVSAESANELLEHTAEIGRMHNGLIRSLREANRQSENS